jgi:threonine dehydrogenase-like Zn-dependent dehydrogenase
MLATQTTIMQAAVFTGPGQIELRTIRLPEPGPGEVRLRLEGCGVCGSNLPVWEGRPWFSYPMEAGAPGHEGWGVIDAIGPGVETVQPGQRVAAITYHAFAEYDTAAADSLVPLPADLDGMPSPGEPLGCAMNVFLRSQIKAGQTVAIIGIGFLGALVTSLAAGAGARVIAISRRAAALDLAREMGASETIIMDDHWRIIEEVKTLTGGDLCDVVIEAVGLQWPLDLAAELTRERGRLVVAGYHQDGPRQINMQLWNWRGLDVINAHERDPKTYIDGMRKAFTAIAAGRLDPRPLFTHRYHLSQLPEAFEAMQNRPADFLKACILFRH